MEDDNEETAGAPETPETEVKPEVTPPEKGDLDLREIVIGLQHQVEGLAETVANLAPAVHEDSTPVKKPWTHYGSR